jgi:hypothetical protein
VHHSRTLFCRAVPNPNLTIRNFFIAVRSLLTRLPERRERLRVWTKSDPTPRDSTTAVHKRPGLLGSFLWYRPGLCHCRLYRPA